MAVSRETKLRSGTKLLIFNYLIYWRIKKNNYTKVLDFSRPIILHSKLKTLVILIVTVYRYRAACASIIASACYRGTPTTFWSASLSAAGNREYRWARPLPRRHIGWGWPKFCHLVCRNIEYNRGCFLLNLWVFSRRRGVCAKRKR